jgi:hypothetical protein
MAWVLAGCLWALAIFTSNRLSGPKIERSLFWGASWSAVAVTFDIDSLHSQFDRAVGVPNLATLVEHVGEVLAITYLGRIFAAVTSDGASLGVAAKPTTKLIVPSILIALLAGLFFVSTLPREVPHIVVTYGGQPSVVAFWLIANGYLAWAAHQMVRIAIRHASSIERREVQIGVVLTGSACALLYPFTLAEAVDLLARWLPHSVNQWADITSGLTKALAVLLFAAGLGTPGTVRATRLGAQQLRDYLNLHALRPMWLEVVAAVPTARLDDAENGRHQFWSDTIPRHIHLKLTNRVIEILDAQLVLAGYVDPEEGDAEAGLSAMAREAARTRAALERRRGGGRPGNREREFVEGRETISDEANYLVGVWQHMTLQTVAARPDLSAWPRRISVAFEPRLVIALISLLGGLLAGHGWAAGAGWSLASLIAAPALPGLAYDGVRRRVGGKLERTGNVRARVAPLLAAVLMVLIGAGVLAAVSAPRLTIVTTVAVAAASLSLLVARLWSDVSGHVSAAAGATTFLTLVASPWFVVALLAVFALGNSRVRVGAHTAPQVVWATLIGIVATAVPLVVSGYGFSS